MSPGLAVAALQREPGSISTAQRAHLTPGDFSNATPASAARKAGPVPRVRTSSRSEQPAATLRSAAGVCGVAWDATNASVLQGKCSSELFFLVCERQT